MTQYALDSTLKAKTIIKRNVNKYSKIDKSERDKNVEKLATLKSIKQF